MHEPKGKASEPGCRIIPENISTICLKLITWKFSWMRLGVMDLGITITFLWTWKRIRTWHGRRKGVNMWTWSGVTTLRVKTAGVVWMAFKSNTIFIVVCSLWLCCYGWVKQSDDLLRPTLIEKKNKHSFSLTLLLLIYLSQCVCVCVVPVQASSCTFRQWPLCWDPPEVMGLLV